MRFGIIGDIHSNLEALEASISALAERGVDRYLCTGDIVGYGADPAACLARLRELDATVVAGNHDWAAANRLSLEYFNEYARAAIFWTQDQLSPADLRFLADLPPTAVVEDVTIVHGTLFDPPSFDYLLTAYDAHLSFQVQQTRLCLVGHSHVPMAFLFDGTVNYSFDNRVELTPLRKAIVNPGSVGQPRDENWKAAYAFYDSETGVLRLERTEYDIEKATSKILRAGLPDVLAERLWLGK